MITAQQAREIAGPTPAEHVAAIAPAIEAAAKDKKRKIHLHGEFWANGGYKPTPEWEQAKKLLEDIGYKVTFHYEERQFVDMYTVVEW